MIFHQRRIFKHRIRFALVIIPVKSFSKNIKENSLNDLIIRKQYIRKYWSFIQVYQHIYLRTNTTFYIVNIKDVTPFLRQNASSF